MMRKPNVILVLADSLRRDRLGCYGYAGKTSPNIDAFADDCVVFSNATSQGNGTLPSVPSLLTGLYPRQHGCVDENSKLDKSVPTLAAMLKNEGYVTGGFPGGSYLSKHFGFDQGFDVFESEGMVKGKKHSIKNTARQAMDFIDFCRQPFFVWINCFDAHYPFRRHEQFAERFSFAGLEVNTTKKHLQKVSEGAESFTEAEKAEVAKLYDNEIAFFDYYFGKFVGFLKEKKIYKDTIIVLVSDHGVELFDHGQVGAPDDNLYEEMINVPLLIKAPGLEPRKESRLVRGIDVLPTVFGLLGKKINSDVSGLNLMESFPSKAYVNVELGLKSVSMIKTNRFKLIERHFKGKKVAGGQFLKRFPRYVAKLGKLIKKGAAKKSLFNSIEFYDLQKDRKEERNLGLTKQAKAFLEELNDWVKGAAV